MIQDNDLQYDTKMHRYRLTKDYVQNELGIDIIMLTYDEFDTNPTTLPDRILKRTSDNIYEYLRYKCKDYYYVQELIEENEEVHEAFKLCLQYQLESFIVTGDTLLDNTNGLDENAIIEKSIGERAKLVLKDYALLTKVRPAIVRGGAPYNVRSYIS